MERVRAIEDQIRELSPEELNALRVWFAQYDAEWDKQIEADARSGRLDRFADEALTDYVAGRTKPL